MASRLNLAPGDPVVFVERLRYSETLPLSLDMTYLSSDIGARVLEHSLESNDVFSLIEHVTAQRFARRRWPLKRSAPIRTPRRSCRCPIVPRSCSWSVSLHLDDGRPVDLEYIRMRGDRITCAATFRGGDITTWSTTAWTCPSRSTSRCASTAAPLCVDVRPLDSLAINPANGKAFMHVDECWYCGPCAVRCPTGAVTVNMPHLLR